MHDGKHGFSKELGRFCGLDFPQIIFSSDRHLWLHFHSDENIEYEGFQAVYEYMPRPTSCTRIFGTLIYYKHLTYLFSAIFDEEACMFTRDGVEGFITHEDIDKSIINNTQHHKISLDCLWKIEVEPTSNVSIKMKSLMPVYCNYSDCIF